METVSFTIAPPSRQFNVIQDMIFALTNELGAAHYGERGQNEGLPQVEAPRLAHGNNSAMNPTKADKPGWWEMGKFHVIAYRSDDCQNSSLSE